MVLFVVNKKKLIVSIIIAAVAFIGDKNTENASNNLAAAICDNVTHGLIGVFTWIGIFTTKTSNINFYFVVEILLCGLCSSLIDADHFIAAKSVNLKDATSLKNRPLMHCTTLTMLLAISVLLVSNFFNVNWLFKFGWILVAAFLSHHIRDSNRRGFWLWPFGSTTPTPTFVYIVSQMVLPHVLWLIISKYTPPHNFISESNETVETV